jgi:predicted dehydrogenase
VSNFHIPNLKQLGDRVKITAVCDVNKELSEKRRVECDAEYAFTDYRQLLGLREVDAVDIMLPHSLHAEVAVEAARRKKHILLEKPIATTLESADAIIEAAKHSGVALMVANNMLFHPAFQKLKTLLEEKTIGSISLMRAWSLCWFGYGRVPSSTFRLAKSQMGGGALIDTGVHMIYLIRAVMGDVASVSAVTGRLLNELHVARDNLQSAPEGEDTSLLILKFKKGQLGEFAISYSASLGPRNRGWDQAISFYGEKGTITLDISNNSVKLQGEGLRGNDITFGDEAFISSFKAELSHFLNVVENGRPLINAVSGASAKEDLRVILSAYRSASEGKSIDLD